MSVLLGNSLRFDVEFRDEGGTLFDPDAVTFTLRAPDGTTTEFTYGVDDDLVKDDVGKYHIWVLPETQSETWTGFFAGTSDGISTRGCASVEMTDECAS